LAHKEMIGVPSDSDREYSRTLHLTGDWLSEPERSPSRSHVTGHLPGPPILHWHLMGLTTQGHLSPILTLWWVFMTLGLTAPTNEDWDGDWGCQWVTGVLSFSLESWTVSAIKALGNNCPTIPSEREDLVSEADDFQVNIISIRLRDEYPSPGDLLVPLTQHVVRLWGPL